jgi:hypothetical protein
MLSKTSSGPLVATSCLESAAAWIKTSSMIFGRGATVFAHSNRTYRCPLPLCFTRSLQVGWADSSQTVKDPCGTLIDRMVLC